MVDDKEIGVIHILQGGGERMLRGEAVVDGEHRKFGLSCPLTGEDLGCQRREGDKATSMDMNDDGIVRFWSVIVIHGLVLVYRFLLVN